MLGIGKGVGIGLAKIKGQAPNRHVHRRELPCGRVELLPIDRDLLTVALMLTDKAFRLHKKAARAHRRVIDAPLIGF